jgi:hypothetical protein
MPVKYIHLVEGHSILQQKERVTERRWRYEVMDWKWGVKE